jgi:hypothetical protein
LLPRLVPPYKGGGMIAFFSITCIEQNIDTV